MGSSAVNLCNDQLSSTSGAGVVIFVNIFRDANLYSMHSFNMLTFLADSFIETIDFPPSN